MGDLGPWIFGYVLVLMRRISECVEPSGLRMGRFDTRVLPLEARFSFETQDVSTRPRYNSINFPISARPMEFSWLKI